MPSLVSIRLNLGGLGDSLKLCLSLLLLGRLFLLGFLAWTVFIRILVADHLTLPLLFFFSLGLSIICLRLLLLLLLLLHSRRFKSGGAGLLLLFLLFVLLLVRLGAKSPLAVTYRDLTLWLRISNSLVFDVCLHCSVRAFQLDPARRKILVLGLIQVLGLDLMAILACSPLLLLLLLLFLLLFVLLRTVIDRRIKLHHGHVLAVGSDAR